MGEYSVTLTDSQEDALTALLEEINSGRRGPPGPPQTATEVLHNLVREALLPTEVAITVAFSKLQEAGALLPEVVRERLLAGLNPQQRQRLDHLSNPHPAVGRRQ